MQGSHFKAIREKAGLTQRRLAGLFEKTIDTIARWERLEQVPPMAEHALRWLTRDKTPHEKAQEHHARQMDHARQMNERAEEVERERRLAAIEAKHPGIFGNGET